MSKLSPERLEEIREWSAKYDKYWPDIPQMLTDLHYDRKNLLSHINAIEAEFSEKNHLFNMKWLEWKTAYDVIEEERDALKSELEAVKKERDKIRSRYDDLYSRVIRTSVAYPPS